MVGNDQLRGTRASSPSRSRRDSHDHRGLPNALRIQRRLWHEKGAAGGARKSRHGNQNQRIGGGKERSRKTGELQRRQIKSIGGRHENIT